MTFTNQSKYNDTAIIVNYLKKPALNLLKKVKCCFFAKE